VDAIGLLPCFDVNEPHCYWIDGGRLLRDGSLGPEFVGDVLAGQTRFWVGPAFGVGFYRAGEVSVAFVFDARRRGLNDAVKLPPLRGQLVDAAAYLARDRGWLLTATEDAGRTVHRCVVLRPDGTVEATTEADPGDGSWLGTLGGKCAAGGFLFAATDAGVVRVALDGGRFVTSEFPDTEPFVDAGCRLLAGADGLYVVDRQEVRQLRMA
jgi:hypothetical protein